MADLCPLHGRNRAALELSGLEHSDGNTAPKTSTPALVQQNCQSQLPKILPQLQCSTIFNLLFGNPGGNVRVGITVAIEHK